MDSCRNGLAVYIEEFELWAEELLEISASALPSDEERVKQVDDRLEEYFSTVGTMPKVKVLNDLANYILSGELKNKDVDKVTNTEYPILSKTQLKRRLRKQVAVETDTLDFLEVKYNKQIDSLAKTPSRKVDY